ncbi:hypothetical protein P7H16_08140 [Paenibacillus larvae]|nr:hypothetical protein [Paenibacillus larvae]MDT2246907.1 hypothetical protein [Paenibacillus larvae]MDT2262788.1 hypothetical protein [Paenibacillus larvae]MDT2286912.1 hypothetical protein [Paenibacillus larvae]
MFGDPVLNNKFTLESLGSVSLKITDGTHHSPENTKNGVPYITAKHLGSGSLDFYNAPTFISLEDHKKIFARCNPEKGDVLYIKDGATTGIACINHYDFEFSMLSSLELIKTDITKLSSIYLVSYLNNDQVKKGIAGYGRRSNQETYIKKDKRNTNSPPAHPPPKPFRRTSRKNRATKITTPTKPNRT